jgi:Phage derived protein Gp49-like (DUF891)
MRVALNHAPSSGTSDLHAAYSGSCWRARATHSTTVVLPIPQQSATTVSEETMVLLHGFVKKTDKTPPADLRTAR